MRYVILAGKIPVLQHQDDIVGDSIAICDYLELKIPNPILAHVAYRKVMRS